MRKPAKKQAARAAEVLAQLMLSNQSIMVNLDELKKKMETGNRERAAAETRDFQRSRYD
jgi:hypothetical protein